MIFLFFAIIFTLTIRQQAVTRTEGHLSPVLGKTVALASLVLWSGVGMSGRAIGFW